MDMQGIANKIIKDDGSYVNFANKSLSVTEANNGLLASKKAIPNKVLNADGTTQELTSFLGGSGSVTDEQIQNAVNNYLDENPIEVGESDVTKINDDREGKSQTLDVTLNDIDTSLSEKVEVITNDLTYDEVTDTITSTVNGVSSFVDLELIKNPRFPDFVKSTDDLTQYSSIAQTGIAIIVLDTYTYWIYNPTSENAIVNGWVNSEITVENKVSNILDDRDDEQRSLADTLDIIEDDIDNLSNSYVVGFKKTTLWDGSATSGSITLSDSIDNYDYLLIYGGYISSSTAYSANASITIMKEDYYRTDWEKGYTNRRFRINLYGSSSASYMIDFNIVDSATITIGASNSGRLLKVVGVKSADKFTVNNIEMEDNNFNITGENTLLIESGTETITSAMQILDANTLKPSQLKYADCLDVIPNTTDDYAVYYNYDGANYPQKMKTISNIEKDKASMVLDSNQILTIDTSDGVGKKITRQKINFIPKGTDEVVSFQARDNGIEIVQETTDFKLNTSVECVCVGNAGYSFPYKLTVYGYVNGETNDNLHSDTITVLSPRTVSVGREGITKTDFESQLGRSLIVGDFIELYLEWERYNEWDSYDLTILNTAKFSLEDISLTSQNVGIPSNMVSGWRGQIYRESILAIPTTPTLITWDSSTEVFNAQNDELRYNTIQKCFDLEIDGTGSYQIEMDIPIEKEDTTQTDNVYFGFFIEQFNEITGEYEILELERNITDKTMGLNITKEKVKYTIYYKFFTGKYRIFSMFSSDKGLCTISPKTFTNQVIGTRTVDFKDNAIFVIREVTKF